MAGRYRALLIGVSTYPVDEHNLSRLMGPGNDTAALRRALTDADTGLFDDAAVTRLSDVDSPDALRAMSKFFGNADRHDVLLLYFSGHGKLDLSGRLHLCMHDTDTTDLLSTAVSSTRINEFVEASRARNMVIVLDCCYAGAFRGGEFGETVAGPGRYILTSCRGTQLANDATAEHGTSYFTEHLVEGLLGAASDRDGDGLVDFSDVYAYVDRQLRGEGRQIPQRRIQGDGDLPLARRGDAVSRTDALQRTVALDDAPVARPTRRSLVAGLSAGVLVLAAVTVFVVTRSVGDSSLASGHPKSGSYTSSGPFRFHVADSSNHPHSSGCAVSVTDLATGDTRQLIDSVYDTGAYAQVAITGRVRWTVNDSRCIVIPVPGSGSIQLPRTLAPSVGDTNAFAAPPRVSVRVIDFLGSEECHLSLVDPTTGQDTDVVVATPTKPAADLTPLNAQTVYLHQDNCGLRISASQ